MIFPNLTGEKLIALDIETHDPSINAGLGSGARREGCCILGIGVSAEGREWYFPTGHTDYKDGGLFGENDVPANNIPLESVIRFLNDHKRIPTVGANLMYDLDYLQYQGYLPDEPHDIQFAGPLLDERLKSYSLDAQAAQWINERKQNDEIAAWCNANGFKGDPRQHLAKVPMPLTAKYCKADCRQTRAILLKQLPELEKEKLMAVYNLERSLIPILLQMKRTGVRMDLKKLERLTDKYLEQESISRKILTEKYSVDFNEPGNITSDETKRLFQKYKLSYELNEKGNPDFGKKSLLKFGGKLGELIVEHRHIKKMLSTYLIGYRQFLIGERVHPDFNNLRRSSDGGDEAGTGIGRFSGTLPNLQQIPRNDDEDAEQGEIIRSLFIPEEGCDWGKLDFSQMEMIIALHFATGEGAEKMREKYRKNSKDFYVLIAEMHYQKQIEKKSKERSIFKTLSLGKLYMMAADKLGRDLGIIKLPKRESAVRNYWDHVMNDTPKGMKWEEKLKAGYGAAGLDFDDYPYLDEYMEAWRLMNKIDKAFPWMKETGKKAQEAAIEQGYVRTILGRKRRFDNPALCYKAFQAIDSGTGADIMKSAMVKAYKDGVFNILPIHITVHDELGVSIPHNKQAYEALAELKNIMETVIPLKVPLKVDVKTNFNSWGEVE